MTTVNLKGATDYLQWKLNAYINLDLIHANCFKIHDIWQERNPSLISGQMSKPKKFQTKLLTCKYFQQYFALIEDACIYWDNICTKITFPKQTRTKNITSLAHKAKWCDFIRWKTKELITSVSLSTRRWVCLVPGIFGTRSLPGGGYTRVAEYTGGTGIPVASTRGRVYQGAYLPPNVLVMATKEGCTHPTGILSC